MSSAFALTAPRANEADVTPLTDGRPSMLLASAQATARPTEVIVKLTPPPTAEPQAGTDPVAASRIFTPKRPVARVAAAAPPSPTAAPTPKPTPAPTAEAKSAAPAPTAKATPKPTARPTAKPGGTTYTREQVIAGIKAGWGGDDQRAIAVAECESSLNPRATSSGGTYLGLWQFHIETWRNYGGSGDPRDHSPQVQTQVAWNLFQDQGWGAWPGC